MKKVKRLLTVIISALLSISLMQMPLQAGIETMTDRIIADASAAGNESNAGDGRDINIAEALTGETGETFLTGTTDSPIIKEVDSETVVGKASEETGPESGDIETAEPGNPETTETVNPETAETANPETTEAANTETANPETAESPALDMPDSTEQPAASDTPADSLVGDSGTWNGIIWMVTENGTRLTVKGSGALPDCSKAPWHTDQYHNNITAISTGNYITNIGANTFADFKNVQTAKIGLRIKTIDASAFARCKNLKTINNTSDRLNSIGQSAFESCESLSDAVLPNTLRSIGKRAFYKCGNIRHVQIPNSVSTIGDEAFAYNIGLNHVYVPDSVTTIGKNVFRYCEGPLTAQVGSNIIGEGMFRDCIGLSNVSIGRYVEAIGTNSFANCISLRSINIPSGVSVIGDSAFEDCPALINVNFSNGLTTICTKAFSKTGVTNIILPATFKTLGTAAFSECRELESVSFAETGVTEIPESAFTKDIRLTSLDLGKNVTKIGKSAFSYCQGLKEIRFPEGLKTIEQSAFAYNSSLQMLTLYDSVTDIGSKAFYYCSSLDKVSIGKGVKKMGDSAFAFCLNLTFFTIHSKDAEYKGDNVLRNSPATLYGYKKSTTETYASRQKLPFVVIVGLATPEITVCNLARTGVSVKWKEVPGAIYYSLYRGTQANGTFNLVATTTALAYLDTAAESGKSYFYYLIADDGNMISEASDIRQIFFVAAPKTVNIANTLNGIQVSWTAVTRADKYYIARKEGSGNYKVIAALKAPTTVYYDSDVVSGKLYTYAVAAYDNAVKGLVRESKSYMRLTTPTVATVTSPSQGSMIVTWGKIDEAKGYQVLYTTDGTFATGVKKATIVGAGNLKTTITGLESGKKYYIRVLCYQKVNDKYSYSGNSLKKNVVVQ